MTTSENTKSPYRVERITRTANPKYIPMSVNSRTRYPDIESKHLYFFDTLEAARAFRAINGGSVGQLSPSGKTYQPVR